jgi:hypothetical protein
MVIIDAAYGTGFFSLLHLPISYRFSLVFHCSAAHLCMYDSGCGGFCFGMAYTVHGDSDGGGAGLKGDDGHGGTPRPFSFHLCIVCLYIKHRFDGFLSPVTEQASKQKIDTKTPTTHFAQYVIVYTNAMPCPFQKEEKNNHELEKKQNPKKIIKKQIGWYCRSLTLSLSLALRHFPNEHLDRLRGTFTICSSVLEATASADRQVLSVLVKRHGSHVRAKLLVLLQSAFRHSVPEGDDAVAATGGEGSIDGVEGEGVDGVDDVGVSLDLAVAFEGVFTGLTFIGGIKELDCYTALDRAAGVAEAVRHALHRTSLEFETALATLPWGRHVPEVVEVDAAFCHRDYQGVPNR